MIERLAWVTAQQARGLDEDEELALAALHKRGIDVHLVDWNDSSADWGSFDRAVLRSPWDYQHHLEEFLAWIERAASVTELVNPPDLIRWNLDKRYLGELETAGIPVTPTAFVTKEDTFTFPDGTFVVKPAVGAGTWGASSYDSSQNEMARDHVESLHRAGQVVLIQPLISSVATVGEWPLVFFDGVYSHSANKRVELPHGSLIDDFFAHETVAPHTGTAAQIEVAQSAVDYISDRFGTPPYARVDLVQDDDGSYVILELELIEPSLFIPYDEGAAERLADALVR